MDLKQKLHKDLLNLARAFTYQPRESLTEPELEIVRCLSLLGTYQVTERISTFEKFTEILDRAKIPDPLNQETYLKYRAFLVYAEFYLPLTHIDSLKDTMSESFGLGVDGFDSFVNWIGPLFGPTLAIISSTTLS